MMWLLARICRYYRCLSLIAYMQSLFGQGTERLCHTFLTNNNYRLLVLFSPVKRKTPYVGVPGNLGPI